METDRTDLRTGPCIVELVREPGAQPRQVWHLARSRGDADWRGIRCSPTEGIVAPCAPRDRQPTCPNCLRLL